MWIKNLGKAWFTDFFLLHVIPTGYSARSCDVWRVQGDFIHMPVWISWTFLSLFMYPFHAVSLARGMGVKPLIWQLRSSRDQDGS